MSDHPLRPEDDSSTPPAAPLPVSPVRRPRVQEDNSEHAFDWDSAALIVPGAISPARQQAMQRQQERLAAPRKTE